MPSTYIPAFAEFFSTKNLELLAWHGQSEVADACAALAQESGLIETPVPTLAELADALFVGLARHCRVEYLFKSVALQRIVYGRHSPSTVGFFFEMAVGEARADIVVVNGRGRVIEIKTDRDDLSRLSDQTAEYSKCFGEVAVFVEAGQANQVSKVLPEYVGIVSMSSRRYMTWHRQPRESLRALEHESLFRLLRKREIAEVLSAAGRSVPDVRPGVWRDTHFASFSTLSLVDACRLAHNALKRRQDTACRAKACTGFPVSLWAAVFGSGVRGADWQRLRDLMPKPYVYSLD